MIAHLIGVDILDTDVQVHHQDWDKLNNCPLNLLVAIGAFNPGGGLRDPYTGQWLDAAAWQRRYGISFASEDDVPDWVKD